MLILRKITVIIVVFMIFMRVFAMLTCRVSINLQGKVIIPSKMRKSLCIKETTSLVAILEGNSIRLTPIKSSVSEIQSLVRQYCNATTTSAIDDLFEMRRLETSEMMKEDDNTENSCGN